MRVVRDIHSFPHTLTHRGLFLLCAETSGAGWTGWKITAYPEVPGLLPEAWSEEGEVWENGWKRGAGHWEVWEDKARVVTFVQYARCSNSATAASRQASLSKRCWKDLTLTVNWWLLPTCSCSYTNIPFDLCFSKRTARSHKGPGRGIFHGFLVKSQRVQESKKGLQGWQMFQCRKSLVFILFQVGIQNKQFRRGDVGGLVRMATVELCDKLDVHDVLSWNPGSLFWTISLPVHKVLQAPTTLAGM